MAKNVRVFGTREEAQKAVAESEGALRGYQVNGVYVAAKSENAAVMYAYRAGKLDGVAVDPLAAPPTEEQILEGLGRLSEEGRKAALKALGRK